jgi:hypothetical protein
MLAGGIAALAAAVLLTGCAGYQLGSMLPPGVKTVYVPTFVNKTDEPMIEMQATQAAIEEIQKDGSLSISGADSADTILSVTLMEYRLDPVSFQKDRRTAAKQYRLNLFASLILKRRSDDKVLVEYPRVRGEYVIDLVGDTSSTKRRGLPLAARDLAHNIVEKIVESWQ